MNLLYKELLPADFSPDSKVWIYQCPRIFTLSEALYIEDILNEFVKQWHSHGDPVKGYGNLFFGRFIVLMADESATGISGCSTDGSVRMIKKIETDMKVQLFDRQLLAFLIRDKIELMPLAQVDYAARHGFILPDTIYFNNTVQSKKQMESGWIIPVKESWLAKKIQFNSLPIN